MTDELETPNYHQTAIRNLELTTETLNTRVNDSEALVGKLEGRVSHLESNYPDMLKAHQEECIAIRKEVDAHSKRADDATNNNTRSQLLLTEAITELTKTVAALTLRVEQNQPTVERSKTFLSWWDEHYIWARISRNIGKVVLGILLTFAAVITAVKSIV